MPVLGELMRHVSLKAVPTVIRLHQTAGIRSLVDAWLKAIRECLDAVAVGIPCGIDLIARPFLLT
tara:strand:+ start:1106 stop:1300 length:195 start_codon:yes stop_codon:yes gene_type:complete